jgi:hypothetical protein
MDMGVYQGTYNGSTWSWATFMTGFPMGAWVTDLSVHADSGILRAWTYGRSVWETQPFAIPNPDLKVNTTNPVNEIQRNSQRISSMVGQTFAVSWVDDRLGTNNWHVYIRSYTYDPNGAPSNLGIEQRVDTTSNTHVAQMASLSISPTEVTTPSCSRLAWHDDRLQPGVNQHIYTQYICSDTYKLFNTDLRVDQHPTNINATNAAIAFQPTSAAFAVAWQADRSAGSALHDIYARFFNSLGGPKGNQFMVNSISSTSDATLPAIASDGNGNIFVAWEEKDTSPSLDYKVFAARYDLNGALLNGPARVDSQASNTVRHDVALGVENVCSVSGLPCTLSSDCAVGQTCSATAIVVGWWESVNDGPATVFGRRLSYNLTGGSPVQINQPPEAPTGVKRAGIPSIAVDSANNFVFSWSANVNDPNSWSAFARSFDSGGNGLMNDFRVDLAGRAAVGAPRVARGRKECAGGTSKNQSCTSDSQCPGSVCKLRRYAFAWRDNRSGHFDMYTRVVPSLP